MSVFGDMLNGVQLNWENQMLDVSEYQKQQQSIHPPPTQQSELKLHQEDVDKALESLWTDLNCLKSRLAPVLQQVPEPESPKTVENNRRGVPILDHLIGTREKINVIKMEIAELADRLVL